MEIYVIFSLLLLKTMLFVFTSAFSILMSLRHLPILCTWNLIVLLFTFKSIVHLQLIFVDGKIVVKFYFVYEFQVDPESKAIPSPVLLVPLS